MKFLYKIYNCLEMLFVSRTIGVRVLVIKNNQILLVKHTYRNNWYTPGGGVDLRESPLQGAVRELKEEAGIIVQDNLELFGIYYNTHHKHDDYVTVYICKKFIEENHIDTSEILEKRWFPLNDLPNDMSFGSLRRIQEYLNHQPISDQW